VNPEDLGRRAPRRLRNISPAQPVYLREGSRRFTVAENRMAAGLSCRDVDLLVLCSSTGYVCPDIGTHLIAHLGFRSDSYPMIVDFQTFLDPDHLQTVGFDRRDGKLRIVAPLLARNGLSPAAIRFWVAHPGGRRVMDNVHEALRMGRARHRLWRIPDRDRVRLIV
jgi:predicted naringenin-chalcone synthase